MPVGPRGTRGEQVPTPREAWATLLPFGPFGGPAPIPPACSVLGALTDELVVILRRVPSSSR